MATPAMVPEARGSEKPEADTQGALLGRGCLSCLLCSGAMTGLPFAFSLRENNFSTLLFSPYLNGQQLVRVSPVGSRCHRSPVKDLTKYLQQAIV